MYVTSDNPRSEDPRRDHRRDRRRARRPDARDRSSPTGARRSRARWPRRSAGDVVVICGKGHEQGQEIARRRPPVRRPHGRARAPAGRRVIALAARRDRGRARSSPATPATRRPRRRDRLAHRAGQGDLFVALPRRARRRPRLPRGRRRGGAAAVLVRAGPRAGARARSPCSRPTDVARGAADAGAARCAAAARRRSSASPGSAGKTSTKDVLRALLAPHGAWSRRDREPQQRARRAADAAPGSRPTPRSHLRDGDARPGADRRARRDRRARSRRDHERRPGAPRVPRQRRGGRGRARPSCSTRCRRAPSRWCPTTSRCSSRYLRDDLACVTLRPDEPAADVRVARVRRRMPTAPTSSSTSAASASPSARTCAARTTASTSPPRRRPPTRSALRSRASARARRAVELSPHRRARSTPAARAAS